MKAPIQNEVAYERATRARIIQNARTGWRRAYGEKAERILEDAVPRMFRAIAMQNEGRADQMYFLEKLAAALDTYGKLSEKQTAAYLAALDKADARKEERRLAQEAKNATLSYVGEVGKKIQVSVTLKKITSYQTQGYSYYSPEITVYVNIMEDANGNVIIYKGNINLGEEGNIFPLTAKVKAHQEYKGAKQTIVSYPKVSV